MHLTLYLISEFQRRITNNLNEIEYKINLLDIYHIIKRSFFNILVLGNGLKGQGKTAFIIIIILIYLLKIKGLIA